MISIRPGIAVRRPVSVSLQGADGVADADLPGEPGDGDQYDASPAKCLRGGQVGYFLGRIGSPQDGIAMRKAAEAADDFVMA